MNPPSPAEAALDQYVDLALRGEAPSVDDYAALHPELSSDDVARLKKLVRALGGSMRDTRAIAALPFEKVGPYTLLGRLGAGGMGVVYLAEDARLGRRVALKLVRPELAESAVAVARFEREARAAARLRHANIVTVFEAGREDGVPYLAMELVPGKSLDEVVAEARRAHRKIAPSDAVRWARDVARALECAHAEGVVHRDVKPSNVRVTPEGKALLLDFGLARDPDSASLSQTGQVHGTLYYVAPEQLSDGAKPVDGRTDVWSLGVTLYELLTGRVPFEGESSERILVQILGSEPVAPRELVPDLERDVETVVLKALEKDPAQRYASASAFAEDLDALLEHRPVRARPTGAAARVAKWTRRKPGHALAVAMAIAIVVGGPLAYAWVQHDHAEALAIEKQLADEQRARAEEQKRLAEEQKTLAETRARELEDMAEFQGGVLAAIEPRELGTRFGDELKKAARAAWVRTHVPDDEIARREKELGDLLAGASTTNAAVAVLRTNVLVPAIEAIETTFAEKPKVQGLLLHTTAITCFQVGVLDLALETQMKAYAVLERALGPDASDALSAEANLGYYTMVAGKPRDAEPYLRHGADGLARVLGADSSVALSAKQNLAALQRSLGNLAEAERLMREILDVRTKLLGPDDPETLSAMNNVGAMLLMQEKRADAEQVLIEVLAKRRKTLGPAHEATLGTAINLAVVWRGMERLADAEAMLDLVLGLARESMGDLHPLTLHVLADVAELEIRANCPAEAEAHLREALEGTRARYGPRHPETLGVIGSLGKLLRESGRYGEALPLLEQGYFAAIATIGEDHNDARAVVAQWAQILADVGRVEESAMLYDGIVAYASAQRGATHDSTLAYQVDRARVWTRMRRFADAERALDDVDAAVRESGGRSDKLARAKVALYEAWQRAEPSTERAAKLEASRATVR